MSFENELENNLIDYNAALWKGIAGLVPHIGAGLGEIISLKIPNQRLDRVVRFLKELDRRVVDIDHKLLRANMYYRDLLEDAVNQSTRALTEKRNTYLATFMEKNKDIDEANFSIKKKLLHTLEALTDTDIEILQSVQKDEYRSVVMSHLVEPISKGAYDNMSDDEQYQYHLSKTALEAHMNTLDQLKLVYGEPPSRPELEGDEKYLDDGKREPLKIEVYVITDLGSMLLKSIDAYKYPRHIEAARRRRDGADDFDEAEYETE